MVHITKDAVDRFQNMFKEQYGIDYTDQEAWEATHNLLGAFEWLLKEDRKQNPERYSNKISKIKQKMIL